MISNPAINLMKSFERIPDLTESKKLPEKGLLSPAKRFKKTEPKAENLPLLQAARAYQRIKKDRLDILEMRKNNGRI